MYKHKVTQILLNEEGYCEKSASVVKKDPDVIYKKTEGAGYDNYTKYGKEMHFLYPSVMDYPAPWCDCFNDWGFYKAYGVANAKGLLGGNFDDYTKGSINLYKSKNAFFLNGFISPTEGDQVFFSKDGTFNGVYHTAFVYNADNSYIYTIEGNTSSTAGVVPNGGQVCRKKYSIHDTKIYGYGRPAYEKYDDRITYQAGTIIDVTEYVTRKGSIAIERGLLTIETEIQIFPEPNFIESDTWFKTKNGYITAYRVSGWVKDSNGWWYEVYDHKYPKNSMKTIDGKDYFFDKNGYMLEPHRLAKTGEVIYK